MPMDQDQERQSSQLFTVRLWLEPLDGMRTEPRGTVRHVLSGETRHFREWPALIEFLQARIHPAQPDNHANSPPSDS